MKLIVAFNSGITSNANFVNTYGALFGGLNLTTKAIVAASLADECLKENALAKELDPKIAASLLNMTMNTGNSMYMGDNISTTNESTVSHGLKSGNNHVINQINFETSTMLAISLIELFPRHLKYTTLEKSTGLMQIPIEMKTGSVKKYSQGINNLESALTKKNWVQEALSIVHGQIHPSLFLAYDLKLKGG